MPPHPAGRYREGVTDAAGAGDREDDEPRLPVGVGPWPGGPDAWPDDDRYDPELLAEGDRRNVVDRYRY